ncbi:hypothetical protein ACO0QE_000752 [Hanseniaspora vineae]
MVVYKLKKICVLTFSIWVFLLGAISVVSMQVVVKLIFRSNPVYQQQCLNYTKKSFILLLLTIFQIAAPSRIRVSTENSSVAPGTVSVDPRTGRINSKLSKSSVLIANHQIYTDWVFLWWLNYTARLGGNVFIMLKKSLASIPILGYGMKNYNFIFLSRKWDLDRVCLHNSLSDINANALGCGRISGNHPQSVSQDGTDNWGDRMYENKNNVHWPYSLLIFPEGTNMSANTRQKSAAFAEKIGRKPFRHVLLPHVTGLREILTKLKISCDVVYDVTIGYSGVAANEYGQDIYKIMDVFMKGKQPKLVDIHIRSFRLDAIPVKDEEAFTNWLFDVWEEKDEYMEHYYKHGNFNLTNDITSAEAECTVSLWEYLLVLALPVSSILLGALLIVRKVF